MCLFALMVKVELAVPFVVTETGSGLKLPLANFGTPLTLRLTLPLNPPDAATSTTSETLEPGETENKLLVGVRVNPAEVGGLTARVPLALELL